MSTIPVKSSPLAERILHGEGVGSESLSHHADDVFEVGPDSVHLVDQRDTRDTVTVGLSPNRLRLGLDPSHRTEHCNGAIEYAQRPLDLGGEINVPRRVDDVDPVVRFRTAPNDRSVAAEVMVIPRSCSCSIQSIVAAPSWTSPTRWSRPV